MTVLLARGRNESSTLLPARVTPFLRPTPIIDWQHPDVLARAHALRENTDDPLTLAQRSFEWVRDHIRHSGDHADSVVTCTASEVLRAGTGFCYAKSHLLAALLRANGVPAGLCYQRLRCDDEGTFCLHGLNAIFLPAYGWYRVDARGNRADVDARFAPPVERLAFSPAAAGELDLPGVWPDPLPGLLEVMRGYEDAAALSRRPPDLIPWRSP